ncbi:MAG: DUF488 family protein [Pseudomonadota bacterium]
MIRIKRIYDKPVGTDGLRVLVDRIWPRGISKAEAKIDHWARNIAPSAALRRWYGHNPDKWQDFKEFYFKELDANTASVQELLALLDTGLVTFLYASKETHFNNAAALKDYLEARSTTRSV